MKTGFISLILFLASSFFFFTKINDYPFQFYDEQWWIGTSYFFDLAVHGDFSNKEWSSYYGYDQPKLTNYFFGTVLYPQYIFERHGSNTYQDFLVKNGFGGRTVVHGNNQSNQILGLSIWSNGKENVHTLPNNTSTIITTVRKANAVVLALGVVFIFLLSVEVIGSLTPSILSAFLLATNELALQTSLLAHAEALFLFFLLATLLSIVKYHKNPTRKNIFIFSILAGLLTSVKLHGLMFIFLMNFFISTQMLISKRNHLFTQHLFISISTFFLTFSLLNPHSNIFLMLEHRWHISNWQMLHFQDELPSISSKITALFERFTATTPSIFDFTFNKSRLLSKILGGIFLFEFFFFLFRKKGITQLILNYFLGVLVFTLFYLKLDWTRYYLPLLPMVIVLFVSYTNLLFTYLLQKRSRPDYF